LGPGGGYPPAPPANPGGRPTPELSAVAAMRAGPPFPLPTGVLFDEYARVDEYATPRNCPRRSVLRQPFRCGGGPAQK
jgi:hypothetical protein